MLNGNKILFSYVKDLGGSVSGAIDMNGSFYSMAEFVAWLMPLL